jgi:hypothetical protein
MKGEAPLGTSHTLAFTFGAFCSLEEKTGRKMPQLMEDLQSGLGFGDLRDFIWAGLLKHHPQSEEEVLALLNEIGYEDGADAVSSAIRSFFGEQKEKDENPTKRKRRGTG